MKRILLIFGGIILLFVLADMGWRSFVTEDYSAVCTRCLQEVHGVDKFFLGIHYSHTEKLTGEDGEVFDPPRPPRPSPTSPDNYEKIFGTPCQHHYVRMGFGRQRGGLISCGEYSKQPGIELRLALIRQLFQTFHRIPNRELARQSYALIDQFCPETPSPTGAQQPLQFTFQIQELPNEPISILSRGLTLLRSKEDWQMVLDAAKARNGSLAMLDNINMLIVRLQDRDPAVRAQVVQSLVTLNTSEGWAAISTMLNDPEIGRETARQIVWGKHFEYFDQVMAIWERPVNEGGNLLYEDDLKQLRLSLTDAEVRTLFGQNKPIIDRLCFGAVEATHRFQLLSDVLAVLNQRTSQEGEETIRYLIQGPYPYGMRNPQTGKAITDPWAEAFSYYSNTSPNIVQRSTPSGDAMREAIKLSASSDPVTWDTWQRLFANAWADIPGNGEAAISGIALKMNASDSTRTATYLESCLEETRDDAGPRPATDVLLAMGFIANPNFLPAIEKFKMRSKDTNYAKRPIYGQYVDFAEHRCRHIQDWKLEVDPTGAQKYVILRNDGSVMR